MIQRVQSIYLILGIICLSLASFTDIGLYSFSEGNNSVSAIVSGQGVQFEASVNGEEIDVTNEVVQIGKQNPKFKPGEAPKDFEYPLYIPFMLLICFNIWILMSYKKLKRQLKLARIGTLFNLILALSVIIGFSMGKTIGAKLLGIEDIIGDFEITTGMGIGFFAAVASLPFSYLTQIAIKRDLKLIQSIDRIR